MRVRLARIMLVVALFGVFAACKRGENQGQIPLEDFFKSPEKEAFRLSPDGLHISYLADYKHYKNIYVMDVATGNSKRITSETDRGVGEHFWADNEEIIFMKEWKSDDTVRLYAINRDIPAVRNLLPPAVMRMRWVGPARVWNDELLVSLNLRDSSVFDVYRLHIKDCRMDMIARNPGNIAEWYTDMAGKLRLAVASDGETETLLYRETELSPFKPILSNNFKTAIQPIGFSGDHANRLFAISNAGRDKMALVSIDLKQGKEIASIFKSNDADIASAGYSNISGHVLNVVYDTWRPEHHFIDKRMGKIYADLRQQLKGYEIEIAETDTAQNRFIIYTYTDSNPGSAYYYDAPEKKLLKLADNNPALKGKQLSHMKPVRYTNRSGIKINGYLTLPKNSSGHRVPVVVIPHNGPWKRDTWGFNTEVQFLANRGYGVFQVNYQGSTGYGKHFWTAGFKEWGGKIQQDITDGVHWLIKEGVADPDRIGIYGAGFGGFCALYGACFNSDLYACAASYSGVTNLFTFMKEIPPYYKPYQRMYFEMVGSPTADADYFRSISPVFHADKIKKPLFIAQGGKDNRSNVNETNQFVKEIKKKGTPISYMIKEDEGHFFRKEQHRLEFYRKLESFFNANLKK
ncbi:Dipeptidyl aminopeptidase/acylaminoacyl peptidase [bacterium A37T11]|nr:Dipeptidyl aminopeptidase/acylaminoacyl peptidase [bacterium A37T11]